MSNEQQILGRVQKFMNYNVDVARTLPDHARIEFNLLRDVINGYFERPAVIPPVAVMPAKKKKVAKKK